MASLGADNFNIHDELKTLHKSILEREYRLEVLAARMLSSKLSRELRDVYENEFEEIKTTLDKLKGDLKEYEKRMAARRRPIALVASLVFACFLLYSTYVMVYGP